MSQRLKQVAVVALVAAFAACSDSSGLGLSDLQFNVSEQVGSAPAAPTALAKAGSGKIDLSGSLAGTLCQYLPAPEARFGDLGQITFLINLQITGRQCPAVAGTLSYTATIPNVDAGTYELFVQYDYPNVQPTLVLDTTVTVR